MIIKNFNLEIAQFAMESVLDSVKNIENYIEEKNRTKDNKDEKAEKDAKKSSLKTYKSIIKKIPIIIQKNGFINTLAFLFSKKENIEYKLVLNHFIKWSILNPKTEDIDNLKKIKLEENQKKDQYKEYIKIVYELSSKEYRILTGEMINLFNWLKRFADGVIEEDA